MLPSVLVVDALATFTIAIMLLFLGKFVVGRYALLSRYSIPEPVIGGLFCAMATAVLFMSLGTEVVFSLASRDILLLYFFAGIGLKSDIRDLLRGGRPLLILLGLATTFLVLQNLVGMGVAEVFGMPSSAGLMLGSVSLTGGVGTTLAWAPLFTEFLELSNAVELGMAGNTLGMIAACAIGGPMASYLIQRRQLKPATPGDDLVVGAMPKAAQRPDMSYYDVLLAWLGLNIALLVGRGLHVLLSQTGLTLPAFVSCLMAGIVLRNLAGLVMARRYPQTWEGAGRGLSLISDLCLGMFLTMALMGLQIWNLAGALGFLFTVVVVQIVFTVAYGVFVVFPCMGRDYEASVVTAGFGGIALGSTATAVMNMTAVSQQHGPAPRAFIVVPLVCGFFIDLVNALVITFMSGLSP